MKKIIMVLVAITLVLAISGTIANAGDGTPSAKTAAVSEEAMIIFQQDWTPILSTTIKTAEKSDLIISLSTESLLATWQEVNSELPSTSRASLQVAVWIDDVLARPGYVILNQKYQTIESSPLPLNAWLRMNEYYASANTFNFIAVNVGAGVHTITAKTMPSGFGTTGWGYGVYKRTMVVDQVRMAKPTQAALTLFPASVMNDEVTVNGYMWIGDHKSVEVSLEMWMGSPTPPADPEVYGPVVMTSDGEFSFGPYLIDGSGITWYKAKLSYNGVVTYSSVMGVFPFSP